MREQYNVSGWNDFRQRYQDTFGWYERDGKPPLLVKLLSVDDSELRFQCKDGMTYHAKPDKGNFFTFIPVMKGVHYYGNCIVLVRRIPARQYKRGITTDNTAIVDIKTGLAISPTFELLESIFGDTYNPNFEKFVEKLSGDVIFDNIFSIIDNNVHVYEALLGRYYPDTCRIELKGNIFFQEVSDVINKYSLPIMVEVV